jgi:hypothetical protein
MNHLSLNKTTKICAARTTNLKSCLVYRFMEIQGNTKRAKQYTIIEKGKCSDIFSRCDIYNCIYISIMLIKLMWISSWRIIKRTSLIETAWRYQRGNQKPQFEVGHTIYWPNEQTMIYIQNNEQNTRLRKMTIPQKTGVELVCSATVSSSCSLCGTRRVTFVQWERQAPFPYLHSYYVLSTDSREKTPILV